MAYNPVQGLLLFVGSIVASLLVVFLVGFWLGRKVERHEHEKTRALVVQEADGLHERIEMLLDHFHIEPPVDEMEMSELVVDATHRAEGL